MSTTEACLVTGGAQGIGLALVAKLLAKPVSVTVLDVNLEGLHALRNGASYQGQLHALQCDCTDDAAQRDAFAAHMRKWRRLDAVYLVAGVGEAGAIFNTDKASGSWQKTLDVDLRAAIVGAQLAAQHMAGNADGGAIVSVASAAGIFPMPGAPVYSAAKSGLVHFTRAAAAQLAQRRVRIATLCPQGVDTSLITPELKSKVFDRFGSLLEPEVVAEEMLRLAQDSNVTPGCVRVMLQNRQTFDWQPQLAPDAKRAVKQPAQLSAEPPSASAAQASARPPLPHSFRRWAVTQLSHDFRRAVQLESADMPDAVPAGHVLVRRTVAGVNASDVNFTSGAYHGSKHTAQAALPFVAGFESVGIVEVSALRPGQAVGMLTFGGFAEFAIEKAKQCVPIPAATPEAVAFLTSGLTASIALEEAGLRKGATVLVTAAAGGTGMFAVQLARRAGCRVVGTCGSADKAQLLRQLGVERAINYKHEELRQVLKAEYPKGIDVVYEAVGGDMFAAAVDAVAPKGCVMVIGMMSQYGAGWPVAEHKGLPEKLLKKSARVQGFFLPHYASKYARHLQTLMGLHAAGNLTVAIDPQSFDGIESVPDAVAFLQSGRSAGKVVVRIATQETHTLNAPSKL